MKVEVKVAGLEELEDALKELRMTLGTIPTIKRERNLVRESLRVAAKPVLADAKSILRSSAGKNKSDYKRTGRLLNAIKLKVHPRPKWLQEIYGIGVDPGKTREDETGAYYGHMVELGTVKQTAKPFLRPALEQNRQKSVSIYGLTLGKKIESVAKRIGAKNAQEVGAKAKAKFGRKLKQG